MAYPTRAEDLAFVERAPIVVSAEAVVPAPAAEVWPLVADAGAWPTWFQGMTEARYTSPEPISVGSTRAIKVGPLRIDEELLAFDVAERFAFRVTGASLPLFAAMVELITLEPRVEGTAVLYRQALELRGPFRALTPVIRRKFGKDLQTSVARLSERVVAGA
jgi:carbon monoxide dehydrogenase subunit G